ncbi:MAG TPA: bifunctional phosphoribosylaminoimidazolecarboxamide formyltransferase/IMP cyclohydrolase [Candidatus Acidoferrales bacterium]|nr:bifunctional phosphoribosylaminoimidazolecarboxamide formyltransferase/IMP cyclohydrolase [Candidatus Acidoferrales bacterium]
MSRRALLSVSDKAGLAGFARGLRRCGFELYSTGGTLRALEEAGVEAHPVSDLTGFPEILDGRVKTLHPGVHAGLLARRDSAAQMQQLEEHGLKTIDLVCVNLYPFLEAAGRPEADPSDVIEQIDVGGPALLRAAAKNHASVLVVARPERYSEVLEALQGKEVPADLRQRLAAEAFAHTAAYDTWIAAWLRGPNADFPPELPFAGRLARVLRYGENPHQKAAFYRQPDAGGLGVARQVQGPDLSFNNIQDAAAAQALVFEYQKPAAVIVKHTNPCGIAVASELADAYRRAYECDTVSAFGAVVALNRPLDAPTAELIVQIKTDLVVAPALLPAAAEVLARRPNTRVLEAPGAQAGLLDLDLRSVPGGFLAQTWDRSGFDRAACSVASRRSPTDAEWEQLELAWLAVKHVKSNAIVLFREGAAVGVGAGQMSRVESVQLAVRRAGARAAGSVLASDAFFPFPDGVEEGLRAGVVAFIQPGGSVKDSEVVAAADASGAAMVMTGERHFAH